MGKVLNIRNQETTVKAIKANDDAVLKKIYTENYKKTEVFILKNSGSMQQAKDIYQEAFIAMWQNIKEGKFTPKNETAVQGYLYQIAKNKWLDVVRSARFKKTLTIGEMTPWEDEDDALTNDGNTEAQLAQVMKGFEQLGADCKELLKSFYFEKNSLRTIAKQFEIAEASARNKKYRCIQQLRTLLTTPTP
ncbi:RNA polymerase sigma factor [Altibacter sp. HG106]|uniref:RNA polymerase sigma factor n=1 Tax=Altibacter sp. HG106 TaxID=3023937 RepID=UPI002350C8C4|nr:sigma-70 family RNA polymerase sigma factor [Altibacter sp. HG106]MDC7994210.1 sigma-70 family RNA polymerase sigma factor [Altibacter sp. HG106]